MMTTIDNESIEELENRIKSLELKLLSNEQILRSGKTTDSGGSNDARASTTPFSRQCPESSQILTRISNLQARLNSVENSYIQDMFQKCMHSIAAEFSRIVSLGALLTTNEHFKTMPSSISNWKV